MSPFWIFMGIWHRTQRFLTTSRNYSNLASTGPIFCFLVAKNLVEKVFLGIIWWMHGRNGLKSGIQNWFEFGPIVALWWPQNVLNLVGSILRRTHGKNNPKFGLLLCHDQLVIFCHSLMILLLLVHFWLCKIDQIWGSINFFRDPMERMAWKRRGEAYFSLVALSPV